MQNLADGMQLLLGGAVFVFYLINFFILGTMITWWIKKKKNVIACAVTYGCFLYFLLFECMALPMKIMGYKLSRLSFCWMIFIIPVNLLILIFRRAYIWQVLKKGIEEIRKNKLESVIIFTFFVIQFAVIISTTPYYMGVRDDSYYIADVTTSVFTNTIQQYSEITGQKLTRYSGSYFLPMYPVQSAVLCQITGLHPIIENKWSFLGVSIIIYHALFYMILTEIFGIKNKRKVWAVLFVLFFINTNYVLRGTSTGTFYIYRLTEGKGFLGNIVMPGMVYSCFLVYKKNSIRNWSIVFLSIVSSYVFAMSGMFIIPVCAAILFLSLLLVKKEWSMIVPMILCMVPCISVIIVYKLDILSVAL